MNRQRKTERSQSCKEKLMKFHRVLNFHSTKDGLLNCITKVYDNSILMDFIKCLVTNMQYTVPVTTFSCYKSRSLNHYILSVFHITLYSTKIFVRIYIGDFQQPLSCKHYHASTIMPQMAVNRLLFILQVELSRFSTSELFRAKRPFSFVGIHFATSC